MTFSVCLVLSWEGTTDCVQGKWMVKDTKGLWCKRALNIGVYISFRAILFFLHSPYFLHARIIHVCSFTSSVPQIVLYFWYFKTKRVTLEKTLYLTKRSARIKLGSILHKMDNNNTGCSVQYTHPTKGLQSRNRLSSQPVNLYHIIHKIQLWIWDIQYFAKKPVNDWSICDFPRPDIDVTFCWYQSV